MEIDGHVAVVTGGASGLGKATAQHLGNLGARIVVLDRDGDGASATADLFGGLGLAVDVSDEGEIGDAFDRIVRELSAPRIVVNCAGIGLAARIVGRDGALSTELFEKTIKVNLLGTYNVMSHAAKHMMGADPTESGERGVIVNTASIAWQDGQLGQSAYAASKGAIASMCLPAAREFAQFGIRVMAIAPGLFHTPMMEGLPEEVAKQITSNIPFPDRLGDPREYGLLVEQIVRNPYLNGTTVRLDGAVRLPPR